jgi:penicillin-binding protein 1A
MKHKKVILVSAVVFGLMAAGAGITYGTHKGEIDSIITDVNQKKQLIIDSTFERKGYTTIYDKDNKVISKLISQNYTYTSLKNIPSNVQNAFVAIEDKDFRKHGAISIKGTTRALVQILRNKGEAVQGGSTITQQLVKNVFLSNKKTLDRKIEEALLAMDVERKYSKDKILEFYLNNVYFGRGNYGVESAAKGYFQKDMKDLTLSETVFLAAIPNNPFLYDPVTNKNNTLKRRNLILKAMFDEKYINKIQYDSAVKEEIVLKLSQPASPKDDYVTSFAIDNAVKDLMKYGGFKFRYEFKDNADKAGYQKKYSYTYSDYDKRVRAGGYSIYTSIDMSKQKQLQDSVDSGLSGFTGKDSKTNKYSVQGAAVSIDNATGYVAAIVGGRGTDDEFNRAFLSYRQPGSAIKPILVYAPAFDNKYHPLSRVVDQYIPDGPQNDERAYFGSVTLRYATEMSLNTVPYILMTRLGPNKLMPYLLNMHFTGIYKEDYNSIAAIGGFTKGASPVEMAGAYSTLEHDGGYAETTCVRKMTYQDGSIIVKDQKTLDRKKVYTKESAYMMTDILKGVLNEDYATGHKLALANGQIAAGKTGTTSSNKDGWFCGYTKYYTTVVWVGADMPEEISNLYGAVYPGQIWKDYMDKVHQDLKPVDFEKPDTVVYKYINSQTGEKVDYNSGVQDMFSKSILDEIEEEKKRSEAAARAQKEATYRESEPQREKEVEKLLEKYESQSYTSVDSVQSIDSLRDSIDHLIGQLIDVDKANLYKDRLDKRAAQLRPSRDKWENVKKDQEKQRQLEIERNNSEAEKLNNQKELLREQQELQKQKEQQQKQEQADILEKEKKAAGAVQKVQSFSTGISKDDSDFQNAVNDAVSKISRLDNQELAAVLKQAVQDKISLLK